MGRCFPHGPATLAEQTLPSNWKFSSFVRGDCPHEPGVAPGTLAMTSKRGTRPTRHREDWAMTAWSRPIVTVASVRKTAKTQGPEPDFR